MGQKIKAVIVHTSGQSRSLPRRMSKFHADLIERTLINSALPVNAKIEIIDRIITNLRSREVNGIIK